MSSQLFDQLLIGANKDLGRYHFMRLFHFHTCFYILYQLFHFRTFDLKTCYEVITILHKSQFVFFDVLTYFKNFPNYSNCRKSSLQFRHFFAKLILIHKINNNSWFITKNTIFINNSCPGCLAVVSRKKTIPMIRKIFSKRGFSCTTSSD